MGETTQRRSSTFPHRIIQVALVSVCFVSSLLKSTFAAKYAAPIPTLGFCWGRMAHQPIPPNLVVDMLQQNRVAKVKLFDADPEALAALANSPIEVMVMVKNQFLEPIAVKQESADQWVYDNLLSILPTGVNITSVSVGNEPFLSSRHEFDSFLVPAFDNMRRALEKVDLAKRIKLTVSFNLEILAESDPANGPRLKPQWAKQIKAIVATMNETGSFFSVNIYPFFTWKDQPKDFTQKDIFFDGCGGSGAYCTVLDKGYDATAIVLRNMGFPNMEVVIGEAGWPSDGFPQLATVDYAKRYNNGLVKFLLSGKGTPQRPNKFINFYLFDLFDQDAKSTAPGPFERRWGVYDDYGRPKYDLDLSGGQGMQLAAVPNVKRLGKRWCVANPALYSNEPDADVVDAQLTSKINDICGNSAAGDFGDKADCSPLFNAMSTPGLKCASNTNSLMQNASYALNAVYQLSAQTEDVCTQDGVGIVVKDKDPSIINQCTYELGLDIASMLQFIQPDQAFSWKVLGYIVALSLILANML
eukprot:TRINITY_DN56551_c0_g1_i1.p1 TRINITY_DN56551_c0_g1~~TRINITY_DN56551_c0_g1_i1.p1  ORF type:complete len:528 (+),score=40.85 TRINITY_DN56551_c0_g1_i1:280-1863(+)